MSRLTKENIKINFSIPIGINKGIVNADADVVGQDINNYDVESMYLDGLASTPKYDVDGQSLKPSGFELSYFKKSGFINWNHQGNLSPNSIIGEPKEMRVDDEKFFLKSKLYSWSNLAKSVYETALNLENDPTTDRTLAYSLEGIPLDMDGNVVSKLLITGCAVCIAPKNNDSYAKICKGITLEEAKELRKEFVFKPVYSEIEKGVRTDYILNLNVGTRQVLVDSNLEFHIRQNPVFKASSIEDIQKAICVLAQGYQEGFVKESKKQELLKILRDKANKLNINL